MKLLKKIIGILFMTELSCASVLRFSKTAAAGTEESEVTLHGFLEAIYRTQGKEISEADAGEFWVDENGAGILIRNPDGDFTCYTTLTELDECYLNGPNTPQTRGVWQIIKTLTEIISKIYTGGKYVCKVIESVSGEDLYGRIGQQILDSLILNRRYKTTQILHKDMSCAPLHSAQCNSYPNVYWETTCVPA